MTKVVTPSTITAGQIGKIQELLGARLRKSELPSELIQQLLASQGAVLVNDMFAILRKRVEAISNMIVRRVRPNRSRAGAEALKATGRKLYVTDSVVKSMPRGDGAKVDVMFFKLDLKGGWINDANLDKEYELRGLKPSDPYSLAAVNEDDPAFADEHPNCTHWKDANGKWCYIAFPHWGRERSVHVDREGTDWNDYWLFAGLIK